MSRDDPRDVMPDFRRMRGAWLDQSEPPDEAVLQANASMAMGVLLGGGFAGSAAAISIVLDQRFPGVVWPWTEHDSA